MSTWTDYAEYAESNVRSSVEQKSGVYRMAVIGTDGNHHPFYVGQSQDLRGRLLQHLSPAETNSCLKTKLARAKCYFRFAYVPLQVERDSEEKSLIQQFEPECNKQLS